MHATIRINNTLHSKCMSLLFLPDSHHIHILNGGKDTCVLGKGWAFLSIHNSRRAIIVGFDHEKKTDAITALDLPNGQCILLAIHESICNETLNNSLLSEFHLREFGMPFDSICHIHGEPNK
jgi:hypothetical protein